MRLCFLHLATNILLMPALLAQTPAPQTAPQTTIINRDASVYSEAARAIYLVDPSHDAVAVLSSTKTSTSIKVGAHPVALALNRRTGMLYIVNSTGRSVSILDTRTNAVVATVATVATAARPYAIAVDEAADKVYVSNTFSDRLTVIDGATHAVTNLRTGSADVLVADPDRHRVYLLGYESDTLTELDPGTGALTKLPAGAMHLWGLARAGKTLYVSHVQDAEIAALDLETHSIRTLATGRMPCAIVVSAATGRVYVANFADGSVTILDKTRPTATVKVSPHPQGLTLDDDAGLLYVASPQNDAVTIIDTGTGRVRRTLSDPGHPYAIALNPSTHVAYAVNLADDPFAPLDSP